jgi:hypothetical protein
MYIETFYGVFNEIMTLIFSISNKYNNVCSMKNSMNKMASKLTKIKQDEL